MDWNIVSAIGSIGSATATLFAAIAALWLGLRDNNPKVRCHARFREASCLKTIHNHPNCLAFEFVGAGNKPVFITCVVERAHFKHSLQGFIGYLNSIRQRRISMSGTEISDLKTRLYSMCYYPEDVIQIDPGRMRCFLVSFALIQEVQKERKELGLFDLDKPLMYYAIDMAGRKYKVDSGASPNSFLLDRTTTFTRVSPLTGKPITSLSKGE